MIKKTTIQVDTDTLEFLRNKKIVVKESYNEVIKRLFNIRKGNQ